MTRMSVCPQCGVEQYCPCENCVDRSTGKVTWRWVDGNTIACGHCAFTAFADFWLDWEGTQHEMKQGPTLMLKHIQKVMV